MNAQSATGAAAAAAAAAASDPSPQLVVDLAEPILAFIVRLVTTSSLWHPTAVAQPLNVLSRTHVPLVAKVVLLHMPHIDMISATKLGDVGLLNLMLQWSKQPRGRPLRYASYQLLPFALQCNSPHVLEWWLDRPRSLFVNWDWSDRDLMEAFCEPVDLMWFQWWKARGFPYLELDEDDVGSTFARMAVHASQNGRVDILDWLLENAGANRMASAECEYGTAIVGAAQHGHVHVLEWWFLQAHAGVLDANVYGVGVFSAALSYGHVAVLKWCEKQPLVLEVLQHQGMDDWMAVFSGAFRSDHVAVLEWCKSQPSVMQAWRQCLQKYAHADARSKISSMCCNDTSKEGLCLDWLHTFYSLPFADGSNVFRQACEKGNLDLVKELHSLGYLLGSRKQLVQAALESGKLELLQWIQTNVDPSIPDASGWHFSSDPFHTACRDLVGNVDILDWMLANGFQFPPPGEKRASIFSSAAYKGQVDALEWLFNNGFASDMYMENWKVTLESASNNGFIDVLDWLAERIPRSIPASLIPTNMLWQAFSSGRVDIIEWWAHKSGWLKDAFDLSRGQPYLQACNELGGPAQLAALSTWFQAGQPMDFAKCIHEASISGRIDVLDWILRSTSSSEEDFVKAWSSDEFRGEATEYDPSFDTDNHGKSLLWWHANLPHICAQKPVNRGSYDNPIHAHYLQHVVKNTWFELLSPYEEIKEYGGRVDLLEYRKHIGDADDLEADAEWYLEEASQYELCDVLEWFKVASGIHIECPKAIVDGRIEIMRRAKAWWAKSGLVDEQQLAKIKVSC